MHINELKLKDILVKSGIVDELAFQHAKSESIRSGSSMVDILLGENMIRENYLLGLLKEQYGFPIVDLKQLTIPKETLEMLPETIAKSKNAVVFEVDPVYKKAKVAMRDPLDLEAIDFLRFKLGYWIEPYLTSSSSLKFGLKQYTHPIGGEFKDVISQNSEQLLAAVDEKDLNKMAEAIPIVTILNDIIEHAIVLNASDIHFEPMPKEVLVRYRIDGILQEILTLGKIIEPILAARVKVLANLQIDEHRVPQDGRFRFELEDGGKIDIRVNIMPVMHGEKVEMRLLRSSARPFSLEELGIAAADIRIVQEEAKKPHGLILVTGPTGHGKTTTLYSILHLLNRPEVNITTIEDPIEYEMSRINQTQVNNKAGVTFANGLRALLRQNPDIIMVGEIRDSETVEIAIHAALTGHLVLSSLHTNDAPSALPRLLDMGAPAFLLTSTVNLVMAQRLVRRICTSCVVSYPISEEMSRSIQTEIALTANPQIHNVPKTLFKGRGCKVCSNNGFVGQIGIFEILKVTDSIRALMQRSAPVNEIRQQAIAGGMQTMFERGLEKVEQGATTIEEVLRVVRE